MVVWMVCMVLVSVSEGGVQGRLQQVLQIGPHAGAGIAGAPFPQAVGWLGDAEPGRR